MASRQSIPYKEQKLSNNERILSVALWIVIKLYKINFIFNGSQSFKNKYPGIHTVVKVDKMLEANELWGSYGGDAWLETSTNLSAEAYRENEDAAYVGGIGYFSVMTARTDAL